MGTRVGDILIKYNEPYTDKDDEIVQDLVNRYFKNKAKARLKHK